MTFDTRVLRFTLARTRRGHYQTLLHHLDEAEGGRQTDISSSVEELANLTRKRSLVVLMSDFYQDPNEIARSIRFFHLRGNDLILFHLLDPAELDPPFSAVTSLKDMETEDHLTFVPEAREIYQTRLEEHIDQLKSHSAEINIDYLVLNTGKPLDQALYRYLTTRARHY